MKIEEVSIDTNSSNDSGSSITLGDSDHNNGTIDITGTGGTGVEDVDGVAFGTQNNVVDSAGDLIIIGTGGTGNYIEETQGVDIEGELSALGQIKLRTRWFW